MMGSLTGRNFMIEGAFASLMYLSLYKKHELTPHRPAKVALETLSRVIARRTRPLVKLD